MLALTPIVSAWTFAFEIVAPTLSLSMITPIDAPTPTEPLTASAPVIRSVVTLFVAFTSSPDACSGDPAIDPSPCTVPP